jgi:selenoprotein W-related protein
VSRPTVKITYCADCGYEGQATELARELLIEFGHDLSSISIIPWDDGTFDVSVDTLLVHSMSREGGFPAADAIKAAVRESIAVAKGA